MAKIFELILEIGSQSKPLKKKNSNLHTHRWIVFVKSNGKIEHCIEKVTFQLHESFSPSTRTETEPPYHVKETGYAGFEIPIHIHFKNREKPNHLTFVHDLCLLTNKPNESKTTEKIKFINPTKDFEKCLIKSGAQLIGVPNEKKRSDSPPAKKRKSSSLIPSKDMAKHSQQSTPQQKTKPSSREFMDVFGAPLMVNTNGKEIKTNSSSTGSSGNGTKKESVKEERKLERQAEKPREHTHQKHHHNHHNNHHHNGHHNNVKVEHNNVVKSQVDIDQQSRVNNQSYIDDLQLIQTKISCLTDCDRLQKIVDIVEEAGEWYNLTPKKFEFDLKRLDKKTLNRIDRFLH